MAELTLDRRWSAHRDVVVQHGLVSGFVGGIVMYVVLAIIFAIRGDGLLYPLTLMGSIWYGGITETAMAQVWGGLTLLVLSLLLGLLFAYLIVRVHFEPMVTGLVYGVVAWFILYGIGAVARDGFATDFPAWALLVGSAFFGVSLGAFEDWADRRWTHDVDVGRRGLDVS